MVVGGVPDNVGGDGADLAKGLGVLELPTCVNIVFKAHWEVILTGKT